MERILYDYKGQRLSIDDLARIAGITATGLRCRMKKMSTDDPVYCLENYQFKKNTKVSNRVFRFIKGDEIVEGTYDELASFFGIQHNTVVDIIRLKDEYKGYRIERVGDNTKVCASDAFSIAFTREWENICNKLNKRRTA